MRHTRPGTPLPCRRSARLQLARLQPKNGLLRRHRRSAADRLASPGSSQGADASGMRRLQARAKRPERGSNTRFVEEVTATARAAGSRSGHIRAACSATRACHLPYRSIRHALGQLEAGQLEAAKRLSRAGTADGELHRRQLPDDRALQCKKLTESAEAGRSARRSIARDDRRNTLRAIRSDRLSARRTRQRATRLIANTSIRMLRCGPTLSWPSRCWGSADGIGCAHP